MHTQLQSRRFVRLGARMMLVLALLATAFLSSALPAAAAPLTLSGISVGAQTGTLTAGTPGSVTFSVSVSRTGTTPSTVNLSVSGLPTGASGTFTPGSTVSFSGSSATATLTVNTTATAAAGTTNITVSASQTFNTTRTAVGTLTIAAPVAVAPTISFGTAPTPTYPGANFTVSATSNSNGALSYSVSSGPCVVVNSTLGIVSAAGVGTCVVKASTTATATYLAGSATQNVVITAGAANPASSCPCDLYAKTGTLTLPDGQTANIYGYAATAAVAAGLPGPTLTVNQGEAVAITLHNVDLPSATSLIIAGQAIAPDTAGVTAGNSKTYNIPAGVLQPGTYLYEAGLTPDGPRQVAMGLYGALIVRPAGAPTQAYAGASTAFDEQATLVLSEIDPALNANPAAFDLTKYAPKYWLINGKGYPNTDAISTAEGHKVLLRYINAGLFHHSMSLLGLHQLELATNGKLAANPMQVVAETVPAGSTLDALVTMPSPAPTNAKYLVFEAAMHLDNNSVPSTPANSNPAYTPIAFGGMMTFLTLAGSTTTNPVPVTSNVSLSPNPSNGSAPVTLSAAISNAPDQAEYFVDTVGADGSGCQISGSLASVSISIPTSGATAPCVDLATLASGNHTFYVHGHNASGWGAVASAVLNLDKTGPAISNKSLTPNPANGTVAVQIQATASDVTTGNQNVVAAEYFIDPTGTPANGSGSPINIGTPAATVSLNATVSTATVNGLSEGSHTIAIRAQDALGNWGAFGTISLVVDKTGPATSGVTIAPNPANGVVGVQIGTGGGFYERVDANVNDAAAGNSNVVAAEYFIDTVGAHGSGGVMLSSDGNFNSTSEAVYAAIDLYVINQLAPGVHTVYVCGKDVAGNWTSTCATTTLVVDKVAPAVTNLVVNPNTPNIVVNGATSVPLTATATDPIVPGTGSGSAISAAEYYIDTDPGVGLATPITTGLGPSPASLSAAISFAGLTNGNHTVGVRAKDAAGNWSTATTVTVAVQAALFANSFPNQASPYGWSGVGGTSGRLSLSTATNNIRDIGTRSLQAAITSNSSGYVFHNVTGGTVTTYHARFYVNPNGVNIGTNTPVTIFAAMNGNTTVFSVQIQRVGTQYQVRATGTTSTGWVNINGSTAIEVARNNSGTLTLYVGGVASGTATVATTNITSERLGLSAGVTNSMSGSLRLDAFVSSRTAYIGP